MSNTEATCWSLAYPLAFLASASSPSSLHSLKPKLGAGLANNRIAWMHPHDRPNHCIFLSLLQDSARFLRGLSVTAVLSREQPASHPPQTLPLPSPTSPHFKVPTFRAEALSRSCCYRAPVSQPPPTTRKNPPEQAFGTQCAHPKETLIHPSPNIPKSLRSPPLAEWRTRREPRPRKAPS